MVCCLAREVQQNALAAVKVSDDNRTRNWCGYVARHDVLVRGRCSQKTNRKHRPLKILERCAPKRQIATVSLSFFKMNAPKRQIASTVLQQFRRSVCSQSVFLVKEKDKKIKGQRSLHVFLHCSFLLPVRSLVLSLSLYLPLAVSLSLSLSLSLLYGWHVL